MSGRGESRTGSSVRTARETAVFEVTTGLPSEAPSFGDKHQPSLPLRNGKNRRMRSQENENLGKPTPSLTDIPFADILALYRYELSVFSKQWGVK
jgi:hypothetical protein